MPPLLPLCNSAVVERKQTQTTCKRRVWLCSNKTSGTDPEVWISCCHKILFPPSYLKRGKFVELLGGRPDLRPEFADWLTGALEASRSLPFLALHPIFSSWPCLLRSPSQHSAALPFPLPCHWSSFLLLGWWQSFSLPAPGFQPPPHRCWHRTSWPPAFGSPHCLSKTAQTLS